MQQKLIGEVLMNLTNHYQFVKILPIKFCRSTYLHRIKTICQNQRLEFKIHQNFVLYGKFKNTFMYPIALQLLKS